MLQLTDICKNYGSKTVADHINLTITPGNILAVLGHSGSGKSTLLKIIAGLIAPDSGEIQLNGKNITAIPTEKRNISLMFQDYALFPHLSARDNIGFGLKMRKLPKADIQKQTEQALKEIGLENEAERKPDSLSGGEQQRLALARALITRPALLLLDEAFSSLDTHLKQNLYRLTTERIRQHNIPTLIVTHSPEEAAALADHIALIHQGSIIQYGSPSQLLNRPANAQAARLLGLPNTTPDRYIPPSAIIPDPQGTPCTILSTIPAPDALKMTLHHPNYGELTCRIPTDYRFDAPAGKHTINIRIDNSRIIHFNTQTPLRQQN